MPKLKTKKGVAKRFRLTKKGKIKYSPSGKSHLLTGKEPERLRHLGKSATIKSKKDTKYLKRMLPYG
ncbi:MAG: 50S ribosomal protein L35 [Omnitrophica WOR_2 bacterium RIFCSPLOWO2_01_FULL_41_12]|nr:MAG: 50S ribosomal protein L35 [Omnitrophica WOR_2 bacterium RIFCSPLOWO2_01_FULL_41_12]